MIKSYTTQRRISDVTNADELPYPCLLQYNSPNVSYIVLAYRSNGPKEFSGIVIQSSDNNEMPLGGVFTEFTVDSSYSFSFYNSTVTLQNDI